MNAGYLGSTQFWPEDEREWLLPPYTAVRVVDRWRAGSELWIEVDVAKDNKKYPLDLPTILL